jgi:hypothetical protein
MGLRLTAKKQQELYEQMAQRLSKGLEPQSIASRIYRTKPEEPKRPQFEGWAPQRGSQWGEDISHRTRGATSPLGGQVKRDK